MRHLLILVLGISLFPMLGCGGTGSDPPDGYAISDGWITTPSGLRFKDLVVSNTGAVAINGSSVTVNYEGWLDNGTVFDSSAKQGQSFTFTLGVGQVIAGWDEGLLGLHVGSKTELEIPPDLGYGDQTNGSIPGGSTLHFWVEIVDVQTG